MLYLSIPVALNLLWTWAYRGGSSGFPIPYSRALAVLSTPILFGVALAMTVPVAHSLWFFYEPAVLIPVSLMLFAPLIWVGEHTWIKGTDLADMRLPWNKGKVVAWVEWGIGIMLSLVTIAVILV